VYSPIELIRTPLAKLTRATRVTSLGAQHASVPRAQKIDKFLLIKSDKKSLHKVQGSLNPRHLRRRRWRGSNRGRNLDIHIYICIRIYKFKRIYIYTCIHTYTYIHTFMYALIVWSDPVGVQLRAKALRRRAPLHLDLPCGARELCCTSPPRAQAPPPPARPACFSFCAHYLAVGQSVRLHSPRRREVQQLWRCSAVCLTTARKCGGQDRTTGSSSATHSSSTTRSPTTIRSSSANSSRALGR